MTKTYITCTSTISLATKLARVVTYGWETPTTKSCDLLIKWSYDKRKKTYIYTYTIPMAIKLGRVVTQGWKTPPTKPYDK